MRTHRFIAGAVLAAALTSGLAGVMPAGASAADDGQLLALTNAVRASVGAGPLSLDGNLSSVALSWAQTMAAQGGISHNPNLGGMVSGWRALAENVGMGATVDLVHTALVASPSHYHNLTNPAYSLIGIGVVASGGTVYIVEDFEQPSGSAAAGAPRTTRAPATDSTPSPAATATPAVTRRSSSTTTPAGPVSRPAPTAGSPASVATASAPEPPRDPTIVWNFVLDGLRAFDAAHVRR
jgi:hypothetical protein